MRCKDMSFLESVGFIGGVPSFRIHPGFRQDMVGSQVCGIAEDGRGNTASKTRTPGIKVGRLVSLVLSPGAVEEEGRDG